MGTKKIIYFLVVFTFLNSLNLGSQLREMTLEEMVSRSDMIVTGEVQDIDVRWNDKRSHIWTYMTVSIEECIKGSNIDGNITVIIPGGAIEEEGIELVPTGWTNPYFRKKENN